MNSPMAGIAVERRRRFAATLGLFAVLFVAVGVVASTGTAIPGAVRVFAAVALITAVLLGAMAWGVAHSVRIDLAEARLIRAIGDAVAAGGGIDGDLAVGCGHDHDVDEMHVHGEPCAHDGRCPISGTDCTHSCDTCVLASQRRSPTRSRAERVAKQSVANSVVQSQP